MFNTIYDPMQKRYHVRFNGSDDFDIKIFYGFIYSLPDSERTFYNNGYWISESSYNKLLALKGNMKLTPYDYQKEAIDFALKKLSSLMLLPCGAGN